MRLEHWVSAGAGEEGEEYSIGAAEAEGRSAVRKRAASRGRMTGGGLATDAKEGHG